MGFEPTTFCMASEVGGCGRLRLLGVLPANRRLPPARARRHFRLFADVLLTPC
jgi:hypothetical protein